MPKGNKTCKKCGRIFIHTYRCRLNCQRCIKKYFAKTYAKNKAYRDRDKARIRVIHEEYFAVPENRSRFRQYQKEWYIENATKLRKYQKDYYKDNREVVLDKAAKVRQGSRKQSRA